MTESRGARIALRLATGGWSSRSCTCRSSSSRSTPSTRAASRPGRRPAFTLHWFGEAAGNPASSGAVVNSLIVATFATAIALVLGTLAALAVQRYSFFGRQTISFLLVLPIALPGVVTGIALRTSFVTFGIDFGLLTIVVGHATFCVVIAYNNVIARLRRLPRSPEEASADLGADMFTTFRRVTLPGMGTALLSGGLLAFALSFDEIIVTNFTAGAGTQTIPMWIFDRDPAPDRAAGRQRRGPRPDRGVA